MEGFNHQGVSLFAQTLTTGSGGAETTAILPAGIGHLVPYRGTAHAVGRPSYLVVKSLSAPVNYAVYEVKTDREDYNEGGVTRAQAKPISVFETVKGNAHWIEGDEVTPGDGTEPGGQWFKVTLEPRQTIRPYGWALGHSYFGATFKIRLYDDAGSYLTTLASIAAYGNTLFPSPQAPGSYLFQNTASESRMFYLQVFSDLGIVHDFEFALVEIMMDLSTESFKIDKTNNYSEDQTIRIRAVRGDTLAPLTDFSGSVDIAEVGAEAVYNQNGGSRPAVVTIPAGSGGTTTFLVRSLVGPRVNQPVDSREPLPALLRSPGFRHVSGADLVVQQWRCGIDPPTPSKAAGCVPDWLQHRLMDLINFPNKTPADAAAVDAVQSFASADLGSDLGQTAPQRGAKVPIRLNPFAATSMRLDSRDSTQVGRCGQGTPFRLLTTAFFHEARHAYQCSAASQSGMDGDADYLVIEPYLHVPNVATVDSTDTRSVCDATVAPTSQIKTGWVYRGDQVPDTFDAPGWVRWALEMDAYAFGAIVRNY